MNSLLKTFKYVVITFFAVFGVTFIASQFLTTTFPKQCHMAWDGTVVDYGHTLIVFVSVDHWTHKLGKSGLGDIIEVKPKRISSVSRIFNQPSERAAQGAARYEMLREVASEGRRLRIRESTKELSARIQEEYLSALHDPEFISEGEFPEFHYASCEVANEIIKKSNRGGKREFDSYEDAARSRNAYGISRTPARCCKPSKCLDETYLRPRWLEMLSLMKEALEGEVGERNEGATWKVLETIRKEQKLYEKFIEGGTWGPQGIQEQEAFASLIRWSDTYDRELLYDRNAEWRDTDGYPGFREKKISRNDIHAILGNGNKVLPAYGLTSYSFFDAWFFGALACPLGIVIAWRKLIAKIFTFSGTQVKTVAKATKKVSDTLDKTLDDLNK